MKSSIVTFLILLFLTVSSNVQAQSLQEVLDKHFKAIGQESLLQKKSFEIKATVKQMGMEIPMTMKMKRPDKFRMEMEMQGQKMIQAYDGENGWMIMPGMGTEPQSLSGPQLEQAKEQANIDGELYNYEEKGSSAAFAGKVNVEGTPMFSIKLTAKDGSVKNYFIDTEKYFIRKVKVKANIQGQEMEIEQNLSDYKEFDGVMMATNIESKSPMGTANIIFEEIKFGITFDDSDFTKP